MGIGTRVVATAGGVTQYRYHDAGPNYLGSGQPIVEFGFDQATVVDELRIEWADGFVTRYFDVPTNQQLEIVASPPLSQTDLVRGQPATLTVDGALPGETVWFLASPNVGPGPCTQKLGGRCLGLQQPLTLIGSATADASGTAQLTFPVPSNAPLVDIGTQAVIRRGPGSKLSALSNVIVAPLQP